MSLRLYIAGDGPNSIQAITNLQSICEIGQLDRREIEIVDVFREPRRALADGIFMTPTLLKFSPAPIRKIVGALSHTQSVINALGLATPTTK